MFESFFVLLEYLLRLTSSFVRKLLSYGIPDEQSPKQKQTKFRKDRIERKLKNRAHHLQNRSKQDKDNGPPYDPIGHSGNRTLQFPESKGIDQRGQDRKHNENQPSDKISPLRIQVGVLKKRFDQISWHDGRKTHVIKKTFDRSPYQTGKKTVLQGKRPYVGSVFSSVFRVIHACSSFPNNNSGYRVVCANRKRLIKLEFKPEVRYNGNVLIVFAIRILLFLGR